MPITPLNNLTEQVDTPETHRSMIGPIVCLALCLSLFTASLISWRANPVEPIDLPKTQINYQININTADAATLQLLPDVGPAMSERIITYRQTRGRIQRIDQLDEIKYIGSKVLAKMRPFVKLD